MRPKKIVLCVDEDEFVMDQLCFLLETKGFMVLRAKSGRDALAVVAGLRVDVVLSELLMSGMDGNRLAILSKEIAPRLPIVLRSRASKAPKDGHYGDVFLPAGSKPVELLERIRTFAARKRGPIGTRKSYSPITERFHEAMRKASLAC